MKSLPLSPPFPFQPAPPASARHRRRCRVPLRLLLLLLLLLPALFFPAGRADAGEADGRLLLYVNVDDPDLAVADFSLSAADIAIRGDGDWIRLAARMNLAGNNGNGQHLAASATLAEANYRELRLRNLHVQGGGLRYDVEELVLPIANRLAVAGGRTTALFLTIPADAVRQTSSGPLPMTAGSGRNIFHSDLCFAAVPEEKTIFVIRTDKARVIATLDGGEQPGHLIIDGDRDRLHALDTASRSISTLELTSGNLLNALHIPMLQRPSFMIATRDNQALLLDGDQDQAGIIDLGRGELTALHRFRATPLRAAYLAGHNIIAVIVPASQEIVLLDGSSLTGQGEAVSGMDATGVVAFEEDFLVSAQNTLVRLNPAGGQKEKRLLSSTPANLVADSRFLYAALPEEEAIGIIFPRQLTMAKRIPLGSPPGEMAISKSRNLLFAAIDDGIAVIDLTSQKVTATIRLGARPADLASNR
ncbi:MAG: hypothetical protein AB1568_01045 [Thermodesulfobacteriota bacterium]